jgi:hypothetical protein
MRIIRKFYSYKKNKLFNYNYFCRMWEVPYTVCRNYKNNKMVNDIWWHRGVKINTKKIKCVEFVQDNADIYV